VKVEDISPASKATRRAVFVNMIAELPGAEVAAYGAQRFQARDLITRKQRLHPIFV
jgi:hypothetical protein